jgi:hypothetical protein
MAYPFCIVDVDLYGALDRAPADKDAGRQV